MADRDDSIRPALAPEPIYPTAEDLSKRLRARTRKGVKATLGILLYLGIAVLIAAAILFIALGVTANPLTMALPTLMLAAVLTGALLPGAVALASHVIKALNYINTHISQKLDRASKRLVPLSADEKAAQARADAAASAAAADNPDGPFEGTPPPVMHRQSSHDAGTTGTPVAPDVAPTLLREPSLP